MRCPPEILAQSRIPNVRGRIREESTSMRVIGILPERDKLDGVKNLIRVWMLEKDHWNITLVQTLKLDSRTKKGQTVMGVNLPVSPTMLKRAKAKMNLNPLRVSPPRDLDLNDSRLNIKVTTYRRIKDKNNVLFVSNSRRAIIYLLEYVAQWTIYTY